MHKTTTSMESVSIVNARTQIANGTTALDIQKKRMMFRSIAKKMGLSNRTINYIHRVVKVITGR